VDEKSTQPLGDFSWLWSVLWSSFSAERHMVCENLCCLFPEVHYLNRKRTMRTG